MTSAYARRGARCRPRYPTQGDKTGDGQSRSFSGQIRPVMAPAGRPGRSEMNKAMCGFAAAAVAAAIAAVMAVPADAADVKIGVIYPLTGNAASAGQSARDAVHLGVDIVNDAHPELKNLPLAATAGLPGLGGAKIELDEADHQGNPQVGQQQTLRLITQDHVAAMLGSYQSSVSLVATAVAERQGVPFLVADSVAANITGRGFKWTFRVTPIAPDFAKAYMDFINDLKKQRQKVDSIAVVNENTDYGTSVGDSIVAAADRKST